MSTKLNESQTFKLIYIDVQIVQFSSKKKIFWC